MFDEYKYAYFYTLRRQAREVVVNAFNKRIKTDDDRRRWGNLEIASIKQEAIDFANYQWSKYYNGDTIQPLPVTWEHLFFSYEKRYDHFNVAIWQYVNGERILQGMAFGKPSRGRSHLSVNWLERSYAPSYFQGGVLLPILACAEEYAKLLGCTRVLVKNPVDPAVFRKYGYAPSDRAPKGANYVAKELSHD